MPSPAVLIVDDEPINFDVIETFLDRQDYELHYAESGRAALQVLEILQPDLILLDVMMPEMDGIATCRQIKAMSSCQAIPIIMVTALNTKSDLAQCLAAGADDFISKPVSSVELIARMNSMLRLKQQYDSIQSLAQIQANTIGLLESTLNELRGNLARSLSHELNTPLNGILGTLGLLKDGFADMEIAEVKELLGWVDHSANRLEKLTQKFLIYMELEQCSVTAPLLVSMPTQCSLSTLVPALQALAQEAHRTEDLSCDLEDVKVDLPGRYLAILLHELVENALKFSLPKTPVQVSAYIRHQRLHISVQDAGRGMTPEQMSKIGAFMQFERHLYEQQGLGIGLKTVKKIIEHCRGEFLISSDYGKGTQIDLSLPMPHLEEDSRLKNPDSKGEI